MMRSDMSRQIEMSRKNRPEMGRRPVKDPIVGLPVMPVSPAPIKMKKGGMVSPRGHGCCVKKKSCKVS